MRNFRVPKYNGLRTSGSRTRSYPTQQTARSPLRTRDSVSGRYRSREPATTSPTSRGTYTVKRRRTATRTFSCSTSRPACLYVHAYDPIGHRDPYLRHGRIRNSRRSDDTERPPTPIRASSSPLLSPPQAVIHLTRFLPTVELYSALWRHQIVWLRARGWHMITGESRISTNAANIGRPAIRRSQRGRGRRNSQRGSGYLERYYFREYTAEQLRQFRTISLLEGPRALTGNTGTPYHAAISNDRKTSSDASPESSHERERAIPQARRAH